MSRIIITIVLVAAIIGGIFCVSSLEHSVRGLYDLMPPNGWRDGGFYYNMYCPDCRKDYEAFMDGAAIVKDGE